MAHIEYSGREWEAPSYRSSPGSSLSRFAPVVSELVDQSMRFNTMLMDRMGQMIIDALTPGRMQSGKSASRWQEHSPKGERECDKPHHHEEECGNPCYHDDCHCRCCIGDADLVVYARLGETRLVPVLVENTRRREREISLELSEWTSRSGKKTAIKGRVVPSEPFTLAACSEKEIVLAVDTRQVEMVEPGRTNPAKPAGAVRPAVAAKPVEVVSRQGESSLPDVDDCQILYADLRVQGCDIRPVRVALALLPRDCGAYEINCGCGCC